jgi:NAD-dependent dihydropyrimidine dehydrogenase PreA subunit
MAVKVDVYRELQRHFDRMPVGYPSTKSGVELKLLKFMFTPEQAKIATLLDYRYKSLDEICDSANEISISEISISKDELERILDETVSGGGIMCRERDGKKQYATMPFIVGMYEHQNKRLTPEFLRDWNQFIQEGFGLEYMSVEIPQMRVIPIEESVTPDHRVATYDELRNLIEQSGDQIAVFDCICRKANDMQGKPCSTTSRRELCMGFRHGAEIFAKEGWGRKISREEALEIARENEQEGMVLQPSNDQEGQFICSCCGDCCGVLVAAKMMPRPADFLASNFRAQVDAEECTGCGVCVKRCHMEAVEVKDKVSVVNPARCIGCGVCVPTCKAEAIKLAKKEKETVPPTTQEELFEILMAHKKTKLQKIKMGVKAKLGMKIQKGANL